MRHCSRRALLLPDLPATDSEDQRKTKSGRMAVDAIAAAEDIFRIPNLEDAHLALYLGTRTRTGNKAFIFFDVPLFLLSLSIRQSHVRWSLSRASLVRRRIYNETPAPLSLSPYLFSVLPPPGFFFGGASGKNPAVSPYSFAFSAFSFFVCLVFRSEKGKFCYTVYLSHCCF